MPGSVASTRHCMTIKQQRVVEKILENPRLSVSEAMRQSGYSVNTAKVPSDLTRSKGWQELLEQHLPDNKLLTKHEEALEATKWNDFTGEREEDHTTRLKAVDMAYKLKGKINTGLSIHGEKVIAILGGATKVAGE